MEGENDFQRQVDLFQDQDEKRHVVLQDLVKALHEAKKDCVRLQHDVESEGDSRRKYQASNNDLKAELQRQLDRIREASYVLVLIDADADGYVFADRYLENGAGGGANAAEDLQASIKAKLADLGLRLDHLPVMIRAFANTTGLKMALARAGLSAASDNLDRFIQDFNKVKHCEFVAVGSGKDKADEKIKALINRALKDPTCAKLVLGICHDNGYVRLLEQVREPDELARIVLLKSFETGREFAALEFKQIVMDGLFRTQNLHRLPAVQAVSSPTPDPVSHPRLSASNPNPDIASYASAVGASIGDQSRSPDTNQQSLRRCFTLRLDRARQRIDEPLPSTDSAARESYRRKIVSGLRFCHDFFLTGVCRSENRNGCKYEHMGLRNLEVVVMAAEKRATLCKQGSNCSTEPCYYRHT